ncbi:MAG: tRNA pseudouridine(38-40) synthase TruA [Bdellovibrionaceae bacterium]|nr:tRNA pseudouridine(38-40) synthase TruA [Pseudobdellovibrionaceae bacterium]|tara:strand:- start:1043 stop:1780 length:738 start_codon:yes stop_codon:yes gene_type:complete
MTRIRLDIQYKGTSFEGWQKQKASKLPTLQGLLEELLSKIYNQPIRVLGSGRTDAGTHARNQVAHCDLPDVPENLRYKLNRLLPAGVSIQKVSQVPSDFHALASATGKTYIYRIWNHPVSNPFLEELSLWVPNPLDLDRLNSYGEVFLGTHDFKSFQTRGTPVPSTIRTLNRSLWRVRRPHLIEYQVQGDGFLKQMVRNLVGLQLYAHRKNLPPEALKSILEAKDRTKAKDTAPAHGLFLWKVHY